jgi:hypothetical protein
MRSLTLADWPIVESGFKQRKPRLASQGLAHQLMESDLLSIVWCDLEGFLCLWAFDQGTVYMPVPPLGPGDFRRVLPQCFAFMDQHNANPEISRIESLSLSDLPTAALTEFRIYPGYPDYLYQRSDLVDLKGRNYRGTRSDYRAFARKGGIRYRPYMESDELTCLDLFERWKNYRLAKTSDPVARKLLEDSRSTHLRALRSGETIGLVGRVVSVREEIVAYTFGFPLNEETFVTALEVTNPTYRGASAYVFREFSKELEAYTYINTMDDSGLPGLRRLKRSYHPWRLEPSFVLYRR